MKSLENVPLKSSKRSIRRHQIACLKIRVSRYWSVTQCNPESPRAHARRVGFISQTPAPCSCPMCGNPRRFSKERSIQERRALEIPLQTED